MARKDITPQLLKKLYFKKLLSKREIALFLNCNITTIHKKMKKFGIPARKQSKAVRIAMRKKIIKIPKYQLENLYLKKELSISEIAQKLHYSRETIKRELKRHKIPLRTKVEAIRISGRKRRTKKSILIKLYYKKRLTQKEVAKEVNRHPGSIIRLMKEYGLKTRKKSEYMTRYPKSNFSGNLEEKAYLIGFSRGDLGVELSPSKNLIVVCSTSTKTEQIQLFKDLFKKYGHIWISKKRKDGNRVFVVRINRTFDFLLLKKNSIPKWIRENKNYFLSFLAGYTDADGCIFISKNNVAGFQIASYDKNILRQIYKQLLQIGIQCNPPRILVKKGYVKSNGLIYRDDYWCFTINKKSSLLPLLRLLKSKLKHRKRLRDLEKAEQNIIERNQKRLSKRTFLKYLPV
ncbi:helix-turn-helix domain-containing protein [bacterium]|nr:helix-turn-helix domain-containing protein [bacterium]